MCQQGLKSPLHDAQTLFPVLEKKSSANFRQLRGRGGMLLKEALK